MNDLMDEICCIQNLAENIYNDFDSRLLDGILKDKSGTPEQNALKWMQEHYARLLNDVIVLRCLTEHIDEHVFDSIKWDEKIA